MGRLGPLTRGRSPEGGRPACGWVFSPDDVFDRDRLLALLGGPGVSRAKGVFRLAHEWVAVNRAGSELTRSVLASPGTPTSRQWPRVKMAARTCSITSVCPTTTRRSWSSMAIRSAEN